MELHAREVIWYAGLGAASERDLDALELVALRRRSSRTLARAVGAFALVPVTTLFLLAIVAVASFVALNDVVVTDVILGAATFALALYVLAGIPLTIAAGTRALKLYRAMRKDADLGRVVVCTGRGSDFIAPLKTAKELLRSGFNFDQDSEIALEVLPGSGVLWKLNHRRAHRTITLPRGATSVTPEFAAIAAKWTRPLDLADGAIEYNRRALSEGEKEELSTYVPDLRLKLLWLAALHVLLIYQVAKFLGGDVFYGVLAGFSALIAIIADRRMLRLYAFRKAMLDDVEEAWVAIVKPRSRPENESEQRAVEYLPTTGAEWTTDGTPAAWRKMYGRFSA